MNAAQVLAALDLPAGATVDQRVPKKLLLEHGAPTAADRRRITESLSELRWAATLKPTTVGIAAFRDERRDYLEIAVLIASLAPTRTAPRVIQLIHRAIPYPVLLLTEQAHKRLLLSLAPLRRSEAEQHATVLDGPPLAVEIDADSPWWTDLERALALGRQPRTSLLTVYDGWLDALVAYQVAHHRNTFELTGSRAGAEARRERLAGCARLELELLRTRKAAAKTKQLARQIELNLVARRLEEALQAARAAL